MFSFNYSGPEKRKYKRVFKRFVVSTQIGPKPDDPWEVVALENVSEGGRLFNHNEEIQEGKTLRFRIKIAEDLEPVECEGVVVHAQQLGDLQLFEYGVQFTNLDPADQALIRQSISDS